MSCIARVRLMPWLMCVLVGCWVVALEAHQDPCHRLHSCPSDHRTYVCGDKGRCEQCPDNQFCLAGKPRIAASPSPSPAPWGGSMIL
jgi:hypothetical protein